MQIINIDINIEQRLAKACETGNIEEVQKLIKAGASVNFEFIQDGKVINTPLTLAVVNGHTEIVRLLVHSGANKNIVFGSNDDTPLIAAICAGHLEIAHFLILENREPQELIVDLIANINITQTELSFLVNNFSSVDVRGSINHRNKSGRSALTCALSEIKSQEERLKLINLLIQHRAEVYNRDDILSIAVRDFNPAIITVHGANFNIPRIAMSSLDTEQNLASNNNPLHLAVFIQDLEAVDTLLKASAPVNVTIKGLTPLMCAAKYPNANIVSRLINARADVNFRSNFGYTALHFAATSETVRLLLNAGADIDARTLQGETPLMHAAKNGRIDTVQTLIEAGANKNDIENVRNNLIKFLKELMYSDINKIAQFGFDSLKKIIKFLISTGKKEQEQKLINIKNRICFTMLINPGNADVLRFNCNFINELECFVNNNPNLFSDQHKMVFDFYYRKGTRDAWRDIFEKYFDIDIKQADEIFSLFFNSKSFAAQKVTHDAINKIAPKIVSISALKRKVTSFL